MTKKIKDLEEMLQANNLIMEEYHKSFEERLKEERERGSANEDRDYNVPYLTNLNEDQMLDQKIYHNFENKEKLIVGKGTPDF